jgi:hypothetical protein
VSTALTVAADMVMVMRTEAIASVRMDDVE